jgi:hypothetical protein
MEEAKPVIPRYLDRKLPYTLLSDAAAKAEDRYFLQHDKVYGWSDAENRYIYAWWLYPIPGHLKEKDIARILQLRQQRDVPQGWNCEKGEFHDQ